MSCFPVARDVYTEREYRLFLKSFDDSCHTARAPRRHNPWGDNARSSSHKCQVTTSHQPHLDALHGRSHRDHEHIPLSEVGLLIHGA